MARVALFARSCASWGGLLREGEALGDWKRPECQLVDVAVARVAEYLQILRVEYLNTLVAVILVMAFEVLRGAATLARGVHELAESGGEFPFGCVFPNVKRHVGYARLEIGSVLFVAL